MANVIVKPEHQAAPTERRTETSVYMAWREGEKHSDEWWKSYDEEMTPVYDEAMKREMAELRDASKSSTEAVDMMLQRFEENLCNEDTKKQRWAGQQRWQGKDNEQMRVGRILHAYTFIEILRRSGVDARIDTPSTTIFTEDDEGRQTQLVTPTISSARIWLNHGSNRGLVGLNAWVGDDITGRRISKTITSLQYPYAQEYSLMRFNDYNIPTKERFRGWRTTLLVLITAGVITEAEALKAFGVPLGPASEYYQLQLQVVRNIRMGITQ